MIIDKIFEIWYSTLVIIFSGITFVSFFFEKDSFLHVMIIFLTLIAIKIEVNTKT